MERLVLDTDVVSRFVQGRLPEELTGALRGKILLIAFVTVGELYKGAYQAGWGRRRLDALEAWLHLYTILPYDEEVARVWGEVSARGARSGRSVAPNDAWIAACCLAAEYPLMTLNHRHFESIEGITLAP